MQPAPYDPAYDFIGFQTINPDRPLPADKLEAEFNALQATLDQILANLALLQRDDTELANKTVGYDQFKDELDLGFNPPSAWATGQSYSTRDTVFFGALMYRCTVAHTSGDFAIDLASGKWALIADFTPEGVGVLDDLDDVVLTSPTSGQFLKYNGTDWVNSTIDTLPNLTSVQGRTITLADAGVDAIFGWDDSASAYQNLSAADARAALGLATTDSPQFTALNIGAVSDTTISRVSAGNIAVEGNAIYRAGGTDVPVTDGGTGVSSLTAYAVMCGGTTSTSAVQSIVGVGTSGQVLTSNGAGALPSFQAAAGGLAAATQADMEIATSIAVASTPGRQHFHPGHPKVWAFATVTSSVPTLQTSYNVTSITDAGTGELLVTIATDFSSANWCSLGMSGSPGDNFVQNDAKTAGTIELESRSHTGALADPVAWNFLGLGDQ